MRSRPYLPAIPILFGLVVFMVVSCRSSTDLVLDDPAFREDMVNAAIDGQRFKINPEDYSEIRKLFSDENPDYRRAGVILADQSGDPMFHPLVAAAALDVDTDVYRTALDVISADPETYRPSIVDLLSHENPGTRVGGIRILADTGGEDLVPLIIGMFNDTDPGVRNQASVSVRNLTDEDNPFLQDALNSSDSLVRAVAIRTIGRYMNPENIGLFIEAFASGDAGIRREAQLAALRLGNTGLPYLHIVALDATLDFRSRLSALEVIQGLRSPESLEVLITLLVDRDERIGRKAESILGTYGNEAIPVLSRLYEESSPEFRIHAVRLMGEIGAVSALPVLTAALDDTVPEIREAAYSSLLEFEEDAWPALHIRLFEGGPESVQAALKILREASDSWLATREDGSPNTGALMLLIRFLDTPELESYLDVSGASQLRTETILSLKDAWDVAAEFETMESSIASGSDPYLYIWRQRELAAVASREELQRSFNRLHDYFETGDAQALADAGEIRSESRRLEAEARNLKEQLDSMDENIRIRGKVRLNKYRETRDYLVRTWEYVIPDLLPLAEAVYADRGLNPHTLSRESALLD